MVLPETTGVVKDQLRYYRPDPYYESIYITPVSVRVIASQNHEHKGERPVAVNCFAQLIQPGKREEA